MTFAFLFDDSITAHLKLPLLGCSVTYIKRPRSTPRFRTESTMEQDQQEVPEATNTAM